MRYSKREKFKLRLKSLGMTQEDLAEATLYSRGYISAVLNGRENDGCLEAIEQVLQRWEAETHVLQRESKKQQVSRTDRMESQMAYTSLMLGTLIDAYRPQKLHRWFLQGLWTMDMLLKAVDSGFLTEDQYQEIVGEGL